MLIYLASVDANWGSRVIPFFDLIESKGLGLLTSATYIGVRPDILTHLTGLSPRLRMVLDSGAFTFKMLKRPMTQQQVDEHLTRYKALFTGECPRWDWVAELDVDTVASAAMVESAREAIAQASPYPVLPVWHRNRGLAEWKRYCREYEYVAFSFKDTTSDADLRAMAAHAYKEGCKVHGFGVTNPRRLLEIPCYSSDSSSWTSPQRFSSMPAFDPVTMRIVVPLQRAHKNLTAGNRAAFLRYAEAHDRKKGDGKMRALQQSVMPAAIQAMADLQDFMTEHWARRGVRW